jgi:hypothetical protein
MTTTGDTLAAARQLLADLSPTALSALRDDELGAFLSEVEAVGRLADAMRVAGAGELDHRSRRSLGAEGLARRNACSRPEYLLERISGVSQAEAARRIRLSRQLRPSTALDGSPEPAPFPLVGTALDSGELDIDAALAITVNLSRASDRADHEQLAAAEAQLVESAQHLSADLVAAKAKMWRDALDPDGTAPRESRIHEKRRFGIGRETIDGLTPFGGLAEPEFAALLRSAVSERTAPARQPRFLDPDDTSDGGDAVDDFPVDPRTSEQRAYDVVQGLLTAGIRSDGASRTPLHSVATVGVIVRASDLEDESGPAWLDDVREPISAALAAQLACDGGVRLIGVGDNGEPLWLGRRERFHTAAQRAALAARDGGCVFPGCPAPPSWCHAHHVLPWSRGGPTDIDNGVLLCAHHHRLIHAGDYELRMRDGLPEMLSPRWVDPQQIWRPVGGARWRQVS